MFGEENEAFRAGFNYLSHDPHMATDIEGLTCKIHLGFGKFTSGQDKLAFRCGFDSARTYRTWSAWREARSKLLAGLAGKGKA